MSRILSRLCVIGAVTTLSASTWAVTKPTPPAKTRSAASKARPKPARYQGYVRQWHAPVPDKLPPVDVSGRPMLALHAINTNDRIEMAAASEHGGFAARDIDRAAFVLRESGSGCEHPVEPRLLDLVYRIQTHFRAQEIRVVSSYRAPRRARASNHGHGRAMDLVVPGATDEEVAKFAREQGFVGVGVYPSSGFVHVDVRTRSYFWIDRSGPGKKNRVRGVLGDLASKSDGRATTRGDRPPPPIALGTDVDLFLRSHTAAPDPASPHEDDDEDDDDESSPGDP